MEAQTHVTRRIGCDALHFGYNRVIAADNYLIWKCRNVPWHT
jgi:hypothetical protein